MQKLLELISDRKGKLSTSRLGFLVWCLGTFGLFVYLTYIDSKMPELPSSIQWILGILAANRFRENYLSNKGSNVFVHDNTKTATTTT